MKYTFMDSNPSAKFVWILLNCKIHPLHGIDLGDFSTDMIIMSVAVLDHPPPLSRPLLCCRSFSRSCGFIGFSTLSFSTRTSERSWSVPLGCTCAPCAIVIHTCRPCPLCPTNNPSWAERLALTRLTRAQFGVMLMCYSRVVPKILFSVHR